MDYKEIAAKYAAKPGGLIEAYHALQDELSYLPEDAILQTAEVFGISAEEAYGVATFYSMFSVDPRGKNIIRICASAPCHIAGKAEVISALEKELGISVGESTADGKFALELTECVGQCQATPVITVNGRPYENVTPDKVSSILAEYS
ncbi:MAG TPA: NAD(P)H-dependent oxidoreductase subunit E [Syntrophomonadaceae bacterium]|nr:NAD(P)H-dependent oxidoreductase subunit E [Syntrophomonadaceae bacterium]